MKIKGINSFERNVEKFVLGGVALVFLCVLALQFVRQPNLIRIDTKSVPPQDAYLEIEREAAVLAKGMDALEPPKIPDRSGVDLLARFNTAVQGDVAPLARLPWSPPGVKLGITDVGQGIQHGATIAEVQPPAPTNPIASSYAATIHPSEVTGASGLAALLPPAQPFDKAAVTVEATFNGEALRIAFQNDPDGEKGIAPMPSAWWRDAVQILGVSLEREELTDTGEWTGATMVPGMPGRTDFLGLATGTSVAYKSDLDALVAEAAAAPDRAQRPEFYETIAGPAWVAPRDSAAASQNAGGRDKIDKLLRDRAETEAKVAEVKEQIETAPESDRKGPDPAPKQDGGRGKTGPGGDRQREDPKQQPASLATLQRQLKTLQDRLGRIDRNLKDLGYQAAGSQAGGQEGIPSKAKPLLEDQAVRIWAHDVTAQPGKTYRYRVRVGLNNPAYDRAAFLSAEQAKLAQDKVLFSAPSDWTSPVSVDPTECFFIVGASEGGDGPLAGTRATAEVYKFFYGFWRQGKVNLEPGDILAGSATLPEGLLTFDMARLSQVDPTEPPASDDRSGGRQGISTGGQDSGGNAKQDPAPGTMPVARDMPIVLDALLLDVARVPGGLSGAANRLVAAGTANQALLRDGSGRILVRIPEREKASELYGRVVQSARDGETQGVAVPTGSTRPDADKPSLDKKEPAAPPGKDGGGGDGGGG